MLRSLLVLVAVSACASSSPGVRANAEAPSRPKDPQEHRRASASDAPSEHGARLAPPFGGTAGVRRIHETNDAVVDVAPGVVAAAERRD